MGWFFVAVGVADFDCGFGGDSFCGDVEFAVFVGEPEQHCYFVAWDPGLNWFAEESLPDDVEWVLVPCWVFCWGGGFFWWWFGKVGNKFKFYIVGNLFALGWRLLILRKRRDLRPCVDGPASWAGFAASRILSFGETSKWR